MNIENSDVRAFVDRLGRAIECINATLSCAPDFGEEVQTHQGLQLVHVRNFVGIGAVRLKLCVVFSILFVLFIFCFFFFLDIYQISCVMLI